MGLDIALGLIVVALVGLPARTFRVIPQARVGKDSQLAMEKQMQAERTKRATMLTAEGDAQAAVLRAPGSDGQRPALPMPPADKGMNATGQECQIADASLGDHAPAPEGDHDGRGI